MNTLLTVKDETKNRKSAKEEKCDKIVYFFLTLSLLCGVAGLIGNQCSMVHQFQLRQTQIQSPRYSVPDKKVEKDLFFTLEE